MSSVCLKKGNRERLECSGGEGCCIYERVDLVPSFDKGAHKERSIANAPEHRRHWASEAREIEEIRLQIQKLTSK